MAKRNPPAAPQVLGFTKVDDFKAYFFKNFVWAEVFANRCGTRIRVIFTVQNWEHVFCRDSSCFDLERAERMSWILEALQRPEEVRDAYEENRDVYVLTKDGWGEDFCVVVKKPNRRGRSHFITAYPPTLKTLLKIRACNPRIWP